MDDKNETLVIKTTDGAVYRIPDGAIESFRVSDEEAAILEAGLNDVSGFSLGGADLPHVTSPLAITTSANSCLMIVMDSFRKGVNFLVSPDTRA